MHKIRTMKRFRLCLLLLPVVLVAVLLVCKSQPKPTEVPEGGTTGSLAEGTGEAAFDSSNVSEELRAQTLAEVRAFVDQLNTLISSKNYNGWKDALSDERFKQISSAKFLNDATESDILKRQKIVLKTPNDYFLNVVIPARSNSRVDEIEFITLNRIKVFYNQEVTRKNENNTTTTETRRLRLYDLEKSEDTGEWKIID